MTDIELAKLDPSSVYKSPKDVLSDKTLSRDEKIEILKRWAYDERELSVAEEENMIGVDHDRRFVLSEILNLLRELGVDSDQKNPPPTKQG
jgi:hypothetical protein